MSSIHYYLLIIAVTLHFCGSISISSQVSQQPTEGTAALHLPVSTPPPPPPVVPPVVPVGTPSLASTGSVSFTVDRSVAMLNLNHGYQLSEKIQDLGMITAFYFAPACIHFAATGGRKGDSEADLEADSEAQADTVTSAASVSVSASGSGSANEKQLLLLSATGTCTGCSSGTDGTSTTSMPSSQSKMLLVPIIEPGGQHEEEEFTFLLGDGHHLQILDRIAIAKAGQSGCLRNDGSYYLHENVFNGGHGAVYRGYQVTSDGFLDPHTTLIIKRMHTRDSPHILACAVREIYFGTYFRDFHKNLPLSRFITHFQDDTDYYLVMHDEGISLQKLLYVSTFYDTTVLLKPSKIWKRMRTTTKGSETMRAILYQLMSATHDLHQIGVLHRDIKPSNILLNSDSLQGEHHPHTTPRSQAKPVSNIRLLLADFSSAVSSDAISEGLYATFNGPRIEGEATLEYAPPEVLLSHGTPDEIAYSSDYPMSYDMWSIGITWLEMILGSVEVFNVDQRTAAVIQRKLRAMGITDNRKLLLLAALADYCIFDPDLHMSTPTDIPDKNEPSTVSTEASSALPVPLSSSHQISDPDVALLLKSLIPHSNDHHHDTKLSHSRRQREEQRCSGTTSQLQRAILKRDQLGVGFNDPWGLDLLSKLLELDPAKRITAHDALRHEYFTGSRPPRHRESSSTASVVHLDHMDYDNNNSNSNEGDYAEIEDLDDLNTNDSEIDYDDVGTSPSTNSQRTVTDSIEELPLVNFDISSSELMSTEYEAENQRGKVPALPTIERHPIYDPVGSMVFTCPKCLRTFVGDWSACQKHAVSRRHGKRCLYDRSIAPRCLDDHALTSIALDRRSGWCALQGRRQYVEDRHATVYTDHYTYIGVFDGHFGTHAAERSASHMQELLALLFSKPEIMHYQFDQNISAVNSSTTYHYTDFSNERYVARQSRLLDKLTRANDASHVWQQSLVSIADAKEYVSISKENVLTAREISMSAFSAFLYADHELTQTYLQSHEQDSSGATATVAIVFAEHLLIAHVGDSRAVLCCERVSKLDNLEGRSLPLTNDHTPYDNDEAMEVLRRGGTVSKGDNARVFRVNGDLAVTRALGDARFGEVVSAVPDILMLRLNTYKPAITENHHEAMKTGKADSPVPTNACMEYRKIVERRHMLSGSKVRESLFLIVASDGLWDVMSGDEASDIVCENLINMQHLETQHNRIPKQQIMHKAAELLAQEAFIRGSADNIGVYVIDLQ